MSSPAAAPTVVVPRCGNRPIRADAADWAGGLRIARLAEDGFRPLPAGEFDAEVRLGWCDAGLLALTEVRSGEADEADDAHRAFTHTSLELFLRRGSAWADLVQVVISPGVSPAHPDLRLSYWDYRGPGEHPPLTASAVRARRADGYAVEALLPWTMVGIVARAGTLCEFRINVNHRPPHGARRGRCWRGVDGEAFHRLELGAGATAPPAIDRCAWLTVDGWSSIAVNAVLPIAEAGQVIAVIQGGAQVASARAIADGGRALAHLGLPLAALAPREPVSITRDGVAIGGGSIVDLRAHARWALDYFSRDIPWAEGSPDEVALLRPAGELAFAGPGLPRLQYPAPQVAAAAGVAATTVRFFAADGAEVSIASQPGRYGAVLTATFADGGAVRYHQTLFCTGDDPAHRDALARAAAAIGPATTIAPLLERGWRNEVARSAAAASALAAAHEAGARARPEAQDRRWWHGLRRRLGTETRYEAALRLPLGYHDQPERRWPAVLYLHGGAHTYPPLDQRGPMPVIDDHLRAHPDLPLVVFYLHAYGTWESPAIADFVARACAEHRIDPARVSLMGFSMGGYGTWQAAVDFPELFAAAVPIGAGPGHPEDAARIAHLPVWCLNGERDEATTCAEAEPMIAALRAVGSPVRYTILPGLDHVQTQAQVFAHPGLWEWLAEQRRPA